MRRLKNSNFNYAEVQGFQFRDIFGDSVAIYQKEI
jgi:hypothetical protein